MNNLLGQAIVFYWMMFNPVRLFQRINELDWYRDTLRTWVDNLALAENAHVLEVACASGELTEYLARSGTHATGIDASDKMIKAALDNNHRRASYQTADAKALPFKDSAFDAVVSASLLNIVGEPNRVIAEMTRTCKQGGVVSVLVPRQGISDAEISELIKSRCATALSAAVLATWHKRAPKVRSRDMLELFSQAGWRDIQEQQYLGGMVTTVSGVKS